MQGNNCQSIAFLFAGKSKLNFAAGKRRENQSAGNLNSRQPNQRGSLSLPLLLE
jgi:hypothetical protein